VTRVGTRIVKGVCNLFLLFGQIFNGLRLIFGKDVQLRLSSLPPTRGANSTRLTFSNIPGAPELVLDQLATVRDLVNQSLDVVDVSTWTGNPLNASFISGQLHLLHEHISEAKTALKGNTESLQWWENSADDNVR
jgi:hypothetical protein